MKLLHELLYEGLRFPIGTVRTWRIRGVPTKVKKIGMRRWVPLKMAARIKEREGEQALASFKFALQTGVDEEGRTLHPDLTKKSYEEHLNEARKVRESHRRPMESAASMVADLLTGAKVSARLKSIPSMLEKLARKPKTEEEPDKGYASTAELTDVSAMRAVFGTAEELREGIEKLTQRFKKCARPKQTNCIEHVDDYTGGKGKNRNYPYRGYHVILRHAGKRHELQMRTKNQDMFAQWSHDIYKPKTALMSSVKKRYRKALARAAEALSEYFAAKDQGLKPKRPQAPEEIKAVFGWPT